jgi:hypothetical protein
MSSRKIRAHKGKNTLVTLSVLAAMNGPAQAWAQAISCPQNIMFGTIMPCTAAAATVTVAPNASTSSSPGCLSVTGAQLQGRCILTGSFFPVQAMQVSITSGTETITSGGNNMDVNGFLLQDASGGGNAPVITITAFLTSVNVGGTLNIDPAQPSGSYSGTVTVNVVYQ